MPHPHLVPPVELDRLLAWQDDSVIQSVAYVKKLNDALK